MKVLLATLGGVLVLAAAGAGLFVYTGAYNVFADDPHWDVTSRVLEVLRDRSIARRAAEVAVPDLANKQLIARGAGQYAAMCATCHLAPGTQPNELSRGLYPAPPKLSEKRLDPRVAFTVVKHGIKMTGMPAWGGNHGDEQVWSVVAFISSLPGMTPEQYEMYVNSPEADAAAAMAQHGAAMLRMGASSPPMERMHGPPGHHDAPATR